MEPRKEILHRTAVFFLYFKKEHTKGTDMAFTRILGLNMELSDFTSHHDSPLQSERYVSLLRKVMRADTAH